MSEHSVSVKAYIAVFLSLMVFTALTVWVATIDFGRMNDVVALGIAATKMLLVASIFMHLKYQAKLLWLVAGAGLIWLVIMFSLTLMDFETRAWQYNPEPWSEAPVQEVVEPVEHH